jgi:hypothetical protein
VRLIGPTEVLLEVELAAARQPDQIAWTRVVTGFAGHRWHCWQKHVKDQVTGMTWEEFKDEVGEQNPDLERDNGVFKPDKTYVLLQNVIEQQPDVFWTHRLTGFTGNRWQVWERFVRGKVLGITWNEFVNQAAERNPALEQDGWVFRRDKQYLLPQNTDRPRLTAMANTDVNGRFKFADVSTPGEYELLVEASDFRNFRKRLELNADEDIGVTLEAVVPIPMPVMPPDIIQARGGEFRLNGQPIRFIGVNIRGLAHYGDPDILGGHTHEGERDHQLDAARKMGARVVRVFLANRLRSPAEVANRLGLTLQKLAARDMYLIVAFTDVYSNTPFRVQGDDGFYTMHGRLNRNFFAGGYKQHYLPFVKDIVSRFKGHKHIFAWELGNELKVQEGANFFPDLFIEFARHVAQEIRKLDPVHLISTGIINTGNLAMGPEQAERLYRDPNLGFLTVHVYPDKEDDEVRRAPKEITFARRVGKPLIIEEIGFERPDRAKKTRAAMNRWFREMGAKGFMQWGFMATDHDNADGDREVGMDHVIHKDYGALEKVYQSQANNLEF